MLTYKGVQYDVNEGENWIDVCRRNDLGDVLGVSIGGRSLGLSSPAKGEARALTFADEEGRRIYERSLRFLLLMAIEHIMPYTRVRVENSLGRGLLITVQGVKIGDALLKKIETEMRLLSEAKLPFVLSEVSTKEAIDYFASREQYDKTQLLQWRKNPTIRLYDCGGIKNYFYGPMVYDTSYVGVFALNQAGPGFVMRLPDKSNPLVPSPYKPMPKLLATFAESNEWLKILNVQNIADLNNLTRSGEIREFIRVNEALVDMKINSIAEQIIKKGSRLVLIAGPSSSGKTTFCNRLAIALRVHGKRPVKLSLDDYYLDRDKVPLDENGKPDLECVEALDTPLINRQLKLILKGEEVDMPTFDFVTQKRSDKTHKIKVDTDAPILIEGIHGLNDKLTGSIPASDKFKIYISSLTNINLDDHDRIRTTDARLIRRLVRDKAFRGTPVGDTLSMWDSVRRGEDKYIFPFQEQADAMINSSLVYELAVMKKYIFDELVKITPDDPNYSRSRHLVKFLNYVVSADVEDEIPLNSLLREFVGGSCFYR